MPTIPYISNGSTNIEKAPVSVQGAYLRNMPNINQVTNAANTDYSRYDKYLGTAPSITANYDHNEIMAQTQDGWDMIGNATMQTLATITGEVLTMTGAIMQLPKAAYLGVTGDDKSFKDLFSEGFGADMMNAGIDFQNYIRDEFKIYQTNEAQNSLALTDATWWASNSPSIASMVASIIVPGGFVKGLTSIGNMAIKGGNKLLANAATGAAVKGASKILGTAVKGLGKGLTTNFAEKTAYTALAAHADIFVEVAHGFKDKVREYEQLGLDKETATNRASEWAANSYRDGVIVGLAFERLEAGLILGKGKRWARIDNNIESELKGYVNKRAKGTIGDIASNETLDKIASNTKESIFKSRGFEHALNLVNEGFEEMRVDFIMNNADQSVRVKNNMPVIDIDTDVMSRLGNFLTEGKNYTSFVFGALGAGVTKLVTDATNPNNNKVATLEHIQKSLNTVQDIDNILSTQFKEQYRPVDVSNPNGLRINGDKVYSPIHDIAQAILTGSSEVGTTINKYLEMIDSLSVEELIQYFEIEKTEVGEVRSLISNTIKELNTLESIRKETIQKYDNTVDIPNKEYKIYYETAIRYSNDYFDRQLESIKDSIAANMDTDPAYQKYMADNKTATASQRTIADQLIQFELEADAVSAQVELAIKDVNKAEIEIPNAETIKRVNDDLVNLKLEHIRAQSRIDESNVTLNTVYAQIAEANNKLKKEGISDTEKASIKEHIKALGEEMISLSSAISELESDQLKITKDIENSIRIKNNYESNSELYVKYKDLVAQTEEDIDIRRKLVLDTIQTRMSRNKANKQSFIDKHKDEKGVLSSDAEEALNIVKSFTTAYVRSSIELKAVKTVAESTIEANNAQLEDVANGTLDERIEKVKPTVREILDITSFKKLTRIVATANNINDLKTLSDQVKNSTYYKAADTKEKNKIDKEIDNKEKEIKEIEESRISNVGKNLTIVRDENNKIIEVRRTYKYNKTDKSVIPISLKVGSFVVLPNGDNIVVRSFEQVADKVFVVDVDGNQYDVMSLFKVSNITNIVKLKMLIDSIDENANEDHIMNLIVNIINTNGVIDDMVNSLNVIDIDVVKELLTALSPLREIEHTEVARSVYNRLSKLYDILIAKQKLIAYNRQYDSLFELEYINSTYDKLLNAIYLSNHNVADIVISLGERTVLSIKDDALFNGLNQSEVNLIQTINNTAISTANVKVVNDIDSKINKYKEDINALFKIYKLSSTRYIKLTAILARIQKNEYTADDKDYIRDSLSIEQSDELSNIFKDLLTLYTVRQEDSNYDVNMNDESTDQLNSFIANGCSELNSKPGDDMIKYFTENIQQAITSLKQIYTHILSYDVESKITPYNIIKYYIASGLSQEQALRAYSNIRLMIANISIMNNYIKQDRVAVEEHLSLGFKNMIADVEYIASKTTIAVETKSDKDIETIYNDIKYEDYKFNNNGVRIEANVFAELQSIDLENIDLADEVNVEYVDAKNKAISRKLTMYDLITIQNDIRKGVNLYVRKRGINGYATYYKYQGGYVMIEKVNYASDNLTVNTTKGIRTVYSTSSFKQGIELLSSNATITYESSKYTPAGELSVLYNIVNTLDRASDAELPELIEEFVIIIDSFAKSHINDKTDFIWKYILDAVIELDNLSETKGANTPTTDVSYETYLKDKTFVNRLKDILNPIYVSNRYKTDATYLQYNYDVAYSNKDIEIIENRLKRANASFIAQYQHRQNLRKYVGTSFKPIKIINVNNASLNYLDNEGSQSLYKALNIKDQKTDRVPYIFINTDYTSKVHILKSNGVDDENKQRLTNNITLDAERGLNTRNLYIIITHANGNTSYAPAYTAKLSKVIDLDNGVEIKSKIDKYMEFIMTSIFDNQNTIANTTDSKTTNIRLSNGRIVSKDQILSDLTHIISTGKTNGNQSFFDFNATNNGLQIEYIIEGRSYIVDITYDKGKPIAIGYGIKGGGFKNTILDENTTSSDLYKMIFKGGKDTPNLLNNLTRSLPFNYGHNEFELSSTYHTLFDGSRYKSIKSQIGNKFIPVYELFENDDISTANKYDSIFDYFVKTNAVVTNVNPILDDSGEILTYTSPDPTYRMSIIAQIEGTSLKSEKDLLDILESDYKDDVYKGIKDMIKHNKSFQGIDYIFDYNYIENGTIVNGNQSVIDILSKLKSVKFSIENNEASPRIMGFERKSGVSTIVYNRANESKLNPISFKSYLSHEIVHNILSDIRNNVKFEKNKDNIRNVFINLIKEVDIQTPSYKQNIQNLLKYIFGSQYSTIKDNIENLNNDHMVILDDILFNQEKWQELITYAYTDINYANMFNEMLYKDLIEELPNNSKDSKLLSIIKDFFKTLLNVLGININEGSYLSAIETIMLNSLGSNIGGNKRNKGVTSIARKRTSPSPVGLSANTPIVDNVNENETNGDTNESIDWFDVDSSLDVVMLGDTAVITGIPTGEGDGSRPLLSDTLSKDNLVSLNIEASIANLYVTAEVKNKIKIC